MQRSGKNEKRWHELRSARKRRLREEFVTPYQHLLPSTSAACHDVEHDDAAPGNEIADATDMHVSDGLEADSWIRDDPASDDEPVSDEFEEEGSPEPEAGDDVEEEDEQAELRLRAAHQHQMFRVLVADEASEDESGSGPLDASGDRRVVGDEAVKSVSNFFVGLQARREVPQKVIGDIVDYVRDNADLLAEALKDGNLPTFRTMRNRAVSSAPKLYLDVVGEDGNGVLVSYTKLPRFPRKEIESRSLKVLYTHYYMDLGDVVKMHQTTQTHFLRHTHVNRRDPGE